MSFRGMLLREVRNKRNNAGRSSSLCLNAKTEVRSIEHKFTITTLFAGFVAFLNNSIREKTLFSSLNPVHGGFISRNILPFVCGYYK
jgi:hypothetical protein